jgi:hypothetical protein
MPSDNPTVYCAVHAAQFVKTDEEIDSDGTQTLVTQTWTAPCQCAVLITLAMPKANPLA